ncbi:MAG: patatin-like phospholipase family protein [Candidatus Nanopelagicales bacterium]
MAQTSAPRRGLVLGGGGILGAAWMVGALKAVEEIHGWDPRTADYIVGTSAGSVLTALLGAGVSVDQLVAHQHGKPITEGPLAGYSWDYEKATGSNRPSLPRLLGPGSGKLIRRTLAGGARKMPPTAVLSAFLPAGKGSLDRVGHLVEAFTPYGEWSPHPNCWIVALDYESGRRVAFGHENAPDVPLNEAVMASCAIPGWFRPMQINGRTYIDGGAWSATSVDLLAGLDLDEVYVLAPMLSFAMDQPETVLGRMERRWRVQVTKRCLSEVNKVRSGGTDVVVLGPGPEDLEAMGANVMDNSRRLRVLDMSLKTSVEALRDPDRVGPDHLADVS